MIEMLSVSFAQVWNRTYHHMIIKDLWLFFCLTVHSYCAINKIRWTNYISSCFKFPVMYICHSKLWKLVGWCCVNLVSRRMQRWVSEISRVCRNFISSIFTTSVSVSYVLSGNHRTEWHEVCICWAVHALQASWQVKHLLFTIMMVLTILLLWHWLGNKKSIWPVKILL